MMPDAKTNENADPAIEPATPPTQPDPSEGGARDPFVVLQNLQRENTELKDKLLRALADVENMRRRTDKEVADAKLYGVSSFARDMLSFADNAHRAIENVPPQLRESDPTVKSLVEGIEIT